MVFQIEVSEIADGWETLVKKIMAEGKEIKDERGSLTKEILNTVVTITNPLGNKIPDGFYLNKIARAIENRRFSGPRNQRFRTAIEHKVFGATKLKFSTAIENRRSSGHQNSTNFAVHEIRVPEGYFWSGDKLEVYSEQFLSKDKQGFVYTYGNRLRAHFDGIDQINVAIERLKNCEESRRSISVTWDPTVDTKTEEVPCMILVDFKIRDERLHTTALWRSHDIYQAWFPNAVGLTHLSKYAADELNVQIGTLTIHSISAHIYEHCFEDAEILRL